MTVMSFFIITMKYIYYTHTHTHIYVYIYIYIAKKKINFSNNSTTHRHTVYILENHGCQSLTSYKVYLLKSYPEKSVLYCNL